MQKVLSALALAVAGALSLTSAAMAGDIRVAYGDLDLSRPADAAKFDGRVRQAAADWCQANEQPGRQTLETSQSACRRRVMSEARRVMPQSERQALQMAARKSQTVEVAAR